MKYDLKCTHFAHEKNISTKFVWVKVCKVH